MANYWAGVATGILLCGSWVMIYSLCRAAACGDMQSPGDKWLRYVSTSRWQWEGGDIDGDCD